MIDTHFILTVVRDQPSPDGASTQNSGSGLGGPDRTHPLRLAHDDSALAPYSYAPWRHRSYDPGRIK